MRLTDTDIVMMSAYYEEQKLKELKAQSILIREEIASLFPKGKG